MKPVDHGSAQHSAPAAPPVHLNLVMILVTGALFMEILDGTIIATALPAMARSFGVSAVALNVGVSAYLLALGVFIPASGWVADRYGARRVFGIAIALFTLTSALCGASTGMGTFVALRILQGIAGAMMVPVGRLVVMRYTPKDQLMSAMATLIWPALVAPVLGPPIGGFITTHFGWRWIFYLNVPLGIAALIAAWFVIPDARGEADRRFDLLGFVLCGAGTFASLSGLERIDAHIDAWSIGLLVGGIAIVMAAIAHLRRSDAPLVDLKPYSIPTFRASLRGGSLSRMAIGSAPFLLPLMFQVGFGYDAFHSGLLVLAVFAGNLGMKSITTPMLRRFGFRPIMIWNGVLCAFMLAACAWLEPTTPTLATVIILIIGGMTRSMQFTVLGSLAFADVPKPQMSHANGLFNTVSQLAMAAGITMGALAVRVGHYAVTHLGFTSVGSEYRFAFVLVALFSLIGLIDAVKLPRGAADHFVSRST
ncbi:MFS transporter [Pararobbsia silviterrae]|uniref:MFS transporter n=1 Tax=Pararobbsia silviterrae TaxID=1792498 RepID=A0A494XZH9_9BURK|nr:MFS transporter [Pararobbsia silviterrae]RKP53586.1 MFS transporter [Pararobbsia silviterrae]